MSVFVFHIVLHTIPSFARISIKTLLAPPPDDCDDLYIIGAVCLSVTKVIILPNETF